MNRTSSRSKPGILGLLAATIAVAAVACGDFTGVPASLSTITDTAVVYAINGSPLGSPTALYFFAGQPVRADASFIFDLAFDIDASGKPVLLPQRAVASGLAGSHTVGLQTVADSFGAVTSAPKNGYRADTALVTTVNKVVLAQSNDPNVCGVSLTGSTLYAKIVVTSVDVLNRQLKIRYTVDPNCGFLSFAPGVPKD